MKWPNFISASLKTLLQSCHLSLSCSKSLKSLNGLKNAKMLRRRFKNQYIQTPVLINPKQELEFHVHTNAFQLVIGAISGQNLTGKFDQPIIYDFRLLNSVERNHITIEKEALTMVYALHKFKHYLLDNQFIFYVNHMPLMYLVDKP